MYRRTNIACKSRAFPKKKDLPLGTILTFLFLFLHHVTLTDELPSTVKALNDGWLATYQISTVVVRPFFTWVHVTHNSHIHIHIHILSQHTPHLTRTNQAALFVIVEVHLLSFVKDESNYTSRHTDKSARHALLIFTYSALFFSLSATISGLILTDEFGELPVRASRKKDPIQEGVFDSGALDLLRTYGAKRSWIWVMWHCEEFRSTPCVPPASLS